MLTSSFLCKFQLLVHSEAKLSSKDEYFGLFNIFLRPLLDENSISRVNGLAGKGLMLMRSWKLFFEIFETVHDDLLCILPIHAIFSELHMRFGNHGCIFHFLM